TGLDVSSKVMASIYEQFQQEPRFRPSSLVAPRVAAGLFGRKSGEGWYRYDADGKKVMPVPRPASPLQSGTRVWLDPQAPDALKDIVAKAGASITSDARQADVAVV